jgi:hypothetical protein
MRQVHVCQSRFVPATRVAFPPHSRTCKGTVIPAHRLVGGVCSGAMVALVHAYAVTDRCLDWMQMHCLLITYAHTIRPNVDGKLTVLHICCLLSRRWAAATDNAGEAVQGTQSSFSPVQHPDTLGLPAGAIPQHVCGPDAPDAGQAAHLVGVSPCRPSRWQRC